MARGRLLRASITADALLVCETRVVMSAEPSKSKTATRFVTDDGLDKAANSLRVEEVLLALPDELLLLVVLVLLEFWPFWTPNNVSTMRIAAAMSSFSSEATTDELWSSMIVVTATRLFLEGRNTVGTSPRSAEPSTSSPFSRMVKFERIRLRRGCPLQSLADRRMRAFAGGRAAKAVDPSWRHEVSMQTPSMQRRTDAEPKDDEQFASSVQ
jgi:hypothetical protein